jgi:DNA invertase Pin-like site-specific DNA recombinase
VYCVNPAHLFLGTQKQNLEDMARKKRSTWGEKNPMAKLTSSDAKKIKELAQSGLTTKQLSKQFNVSTSNITAILRKERWNHG